MKFFKILYSLLLMLLFGFGCTGNKTISEKPFQSVEFNDKWIIITAEENYNIEDSYKKQFLPESVSPTNLENLKNIFGEPDNFYTDHDKNEDIYEFYLDNGKYVLTNFDVETYEKAEFALEYFPNNLKFNDFFNEQIAKYIIEQQKIYDEVIVILQPYNDNGERKINLLAVIKGSNIESIN